VTRRLLHAGHRWAQSKAFALPNDYSGAIRINLSGREPRGVVRPHEYEAVCDKIEHELKQLVNPDTGAPVVRDVIRPQRLYPGEELGDFPDLIITWTNDAPVSTVTSPSVGTISRAFPERRSGAHRNDCFVLSSRALNSHEGAGASLLDLAPTIFELLGSPPARHFDGRSLLA
jgi:predicted AlkP superfamily phosphohydrolase/phosphomutase